MGNFGIMAVRGEIEELSTQFTVDACTSQLSGIRRIVTDTLGRAGVDIDVIDDVELAVSEAATNVIQHTDSPTVSIAVGECEGGWAFDVGAAESLLDLSASAGPMPNGERISGRGLYIIRALMDRVDVIDVGDDRVLRCVKFAS